MSKKYNGNKNHCNEKSSIKNYYYKIDFLEQLKNKCGSIKTITLYTTYPGLLVGSGYICTTEIDGVNIGFLFDYVSGCPYIPGSEIKGMLRSYFPKSVDDPKFNYIKDIFSKNLELEDPSFELITQIEKSIFENNDCFIGAYPNTEGNILDFDYITPHIKNEALDNNDIFTNPVPLKMIKVKPGVEFEFCFILNDTIIDMDGEKITLSVENKLKIFKQIILDMGVGAKTSVGFSHFTSNKPKKLINKEEPKSYFNMNYVFYNSLDQINKGK